RAVVQAGQARHASESSSTAGPLDHLGERTAGQDATAKLAVRAIAPAVDSPGGQLRVYVFAFADEAGDVAEGSAAAGTGDGHRSGRARSADRPAVTRPGHGVVAELAILVQAPADRPARGQRRAEPVDLRLHLPHAGQQSRSADALD